MVDFFSSLGLVTWDWDPVMVHLGPISLRYYGILFALALAVGYITLRWRYRDEHEDPEKATNLTYALMIAIIVGTRLVHCLFYDPDYYLANPVEIIKFWKGGLASHGAAVGIMLTCLCYDYIWRKTPARVTLDRMAMTIPFAMICVRLGNFFNSEIVGARCDLATAPIQCDSNSWFAFVFPRYMPNGIPDSFPRYPSQLFEVAMGVIAMIVMFGVYYYYKKSNKPRPLGLMTSLILVLYFGMRFFVEYFKEYQVEDRIGGLREGQILSIPFLALGLILLCMSLFGPWRKQNVLQYTKKYQLDADENDNDLIKAVEASEKAENAAQIALKAAEKAENAAEIATEASEKAVNATEKAEKSDEA